MTALKALPTEALRWQCDPAGLNFKTTDELTDIDQVVGQPRAVAAIEFGIGIKRQGYNLFCLGPSGTGKHSIVESFLRRAATDKPVPSDWCYVHNFDEPHKPSALKLPTGRAIPFRDAMGQLVRELKAAIPAAFENNDYQSRRQLIEEEFRGHQAKVFQTVQEEAQAKNIAIVQGQQGFVFTPTQDGEPMKPEAFNALPEDQKAETRTSIEGLQIRMQDVMRQMPALEKETREKLRELNRETARRATGALLDGIRESFTDLPEVVAYLGRIEDDVVANLFDFLKAASEGAAPGEAGAKGVASLVAGTNELTGGDEPASFRRYLVNVLVHGNNGAGAPVIIEDAPSLGNLIGNIEQTARFGTLTTDFTLIKPGALHRANGGYLVLDARKLLTQQMSWEELKRALINLEIRIGSLAQLTGYQSTVSLEPEPIPLDVKVVLVGEPGLYYTLSAQDPDFSHLFKVQAEFRDRMERTEQSIEHYSRLVASIVRREGLCPLDASAVALVIEHSARVVADRERLSARIGFIGDLVREADYWAGAEGCKTVTAKEVNQAIEATTYRADGVRDAMYEQIARETVLIDTEGEAVGQINGLSVLQIGGFSFGKPARVSAKVRLGRGEFIDIERQVSLGGPLHSKGVLILSGFLGARFGQERPLALSASLVFEQSYGGVDGDSASSTELYALLSALSDIPIKQSIAVTGSVSQNGEVQAIGGANQKIEGFFDICKADGLTGEQGVMIPASNVKHLMLRQDVVDACDAGKFHIYAVETIDQGIEVLTGVKAGTRKKDGSWQKDTVNFRVAARLERYVQQARRHAAQLSETEEK
jgi:lon-related putative ATP-dependent protease